MNLSDPYNSDRSPPVSKQTKGPFAHRERGESIVSLMVGLLISSAVIYGLVTMVQRGQQGAKSSETRFEIERIKKAIAEGFDCQATLGLSPTASLPAACPIATIPLRRANGRIIDLKPWTSHITCTTGPTAELKIGLRRAGNDPLTGKPWNNKVTMKALGGQTVANDAFGGTSEFCHKYLVTEPSCSGAYDQFRGDTNAGPLCCRRVVNLGNSAPDYIARASCAANEYLESGGGSCHSIYTGVINPPGYAGIVKRSFPDVASNSWVHDCMRVAANGSGNVGLLDNQAVAYAVCCPQ